VLLRDRGNRINYFLLEIHKRIIIWEKKEILLFGIRIVLRLTVHEINKSGRSKGRRKRIGTRRLSIEASGNSRKLSKSVKALQVSRGFCFFPENLFSS